MPEEAPFRNALRLIPSLHIFSPQIMRRGRHEMIEDDGVDLAESETADVVQIVVVKKMPGEIREPVVQGTVDPL
jgi:hypothetical protein